MDRNGEKLSVEIRVLNPDEANARLNEIAALRIRIFRDFPYIYDGSLQYEVQYLRRYFQAPDARFVAAFSTEIATADNVKKEVLVGVATCLPLTQEEDFVQKPFLKAGFKPEDVFYFGESVLLPQYRGRGVGHRFFEEREKIARSHGARITAFCAVNRSAEHPLRPQDYRGLDTFWSSRGYIRQPELQSRFSWKDLNEPAESEKNMIYWLKRWD